MRTEKNMQAVDSWCAWRTLQTGLTLNAMIFRINQSFPNCNEPGVHPLSVQRDSPGPADTAWLSIRQSLPLQLSNNPQRVVQPRQGSRLAGDCAFTALTSGLIPSFSSIEFMITASIGIA